MDRLDEIRARCEAFEDSNDSYKGVRPQYILPVLADDGYPHNWAEIAAHSHEDIPYLLARAEKAESYICQLKKQLSNAMKERDTYKAEAEKQRWIPASERLPEIIEDESSAEILIAVKYAYDQPGEKPFICCGYLLDGEWWSYTEHNCHRIGEKLNIGDTVTHWRLLPEPPKGV